MYALLYLAKSFCTLHPSADVTFDPVAEPEVIIAAADADVFGGREDVKLMVEGEGRPGKTVRHVIIRICIPFVRLF